MARIIKAKKGYSIPLGWVGEEKATLVEFDIADYIRDFGQGDFSLLNLRFGDSEAYLCDDELSVRDNNLYWLIRERDTEREGEGYCQIIYTVGGVVAKSERFVTSVGESLIQADS